jgi:hypothetical protein
MQRDRAKRPFHGLDHDPGQMREKIVNTPRT